MNWYDYIIVILIAVSIQHVGQVRESCERWFHYETAIGKVKQPYLDYLIKRNKAKNHKPKRVSDEQWADYKAKRSESMRKAPKQPQKKTSDTSATAPTADNAKTKPRRSTRKKK